MIDNRTKTLMNFILLTSLLYEKGQEKTPGEKAKVSLRPESVNRK
ncbi:MAG: hypothetical protein PQJ60_02420 [Spirochaetales bacterium]|nr:hypothetical protein [Spirochaetales bacterium]